LSSVRGPVELALLGLVWLKHVFLCTVSDPKIGPLKLKILQISSATTLGGGERHLADLANGLAAHGHDVYVALRPRSPLIGELHSIPKQNIKTLPLRNSFDAVSASELARLVRKNDIQIVHAHMARDYPLAAYAAQRNSQARLIVTRHVLFPLNRLHRITLSRAARVIAVSQAVAEQIASDKVVPANKVSVVLNGIDVQRFQNANANFDRNGFLEEWNLPKDKRLVGTVGELTPLKGQEELVRAASLILQRVPDARFVIAGIDHSPGKKYRRLLETIIEERNLTNFIILVDWIENLAHLYRCVSVFVSASHTESFGLVIAEAMASGTAVVATETAGAVELVRPAETGLLVPIGDVGRLADAIVRVLTEKDLARRLGTAAQQIAVQKFTIERMVNETEKIYTEVL
jgi:glycosyltransferase involved in cell wall biosynthesis